MFRSRAGTGGSSNYQPSPTTMPMYAMQGQQLNPGIGSGTTMGMPGMIGMQQMPPPYTVGQIPMMGGPQMPPPMVAYPDPMTATKQPALSSPEPDENMYETCVYLDIDDVNPEFDFRNRVIGEKGENLEYLRRTTGAKVLLRGKGSGVHTSRPPHLFISHATLKGMEEAERLSVNLVKVVQEDYEEFKLKKAANKSFSSGNDYSQSTPGTHIEYRGGGSESLDDIPGYQDSMKTSSSSSMNTTSGMNIIHDYGHTRKSFGSSSGATDETVRDYGHGRRSNLDDLSTLDRLAYEDREKRHSDMSGSSFDRNGSYMRGPDNDRSMAREESSSYSRSQKSSRDESEYDRGYKRMRTDSSHDSFQRPTESMSHSSRIAESLGGTHWEGPSEEEMSGSSDMILTDTLEQWVFCQCERLMKTQIDEVSLRNLKRSVEKIGQHDMQSALPVKPQSSTYCKLCKIEVSDMQQHLTQYSHSSLYLLRQIQLGSYFIEYYSDVPIPGVITNGGRVLAMDTLTFGPCIPETNRERYKELLVYSGAYLAYKCGVCSMGHIKTLSQWVQHATSKKHGKKCLELMVELGFETYLSKFAQIPIPPPRNAMGMINEVMFVNIHPSVPRMRSTGNLGRQESVSSSSSAMNDGLLGSPQMASQVMASHGMTSLDRASVNMGQTGFNSQGMMNQQRGQGTMNQQRGQGTMNQQRGQGTMNQQRSQGTMNQQRSQAMMNQQRGSSTGRGGTLQQLASLAPQDRQLVLQVQILTGVADLGVIKTIVASLKNMDPGMLLTLSKMDPLAVRHALSGNQALRGMELSLVQRVIQLYLKTYYGSGMSSVSSSSSSSSSSQRRTDRSSTGRTSRWDTVSQSQSRSSGSKSKDSLGRTTSRDRSDQGKSYSSPQAKRSSTGKSDERSSQSRATQQRSQTTTSSQKRSSDRDRDNASKDRPRPSDSPNKDHKGRSADKSDSKGRTERGTSNTTSKDNKTAKQGDVKNPQKKDKPQAIKTDQEQKKQTVPSGENPEDPDLVIIEESAEKQEKDHSKDTNTTKTGEANNQATETSKAEKDAVQKPAKEASDKSHESGPPKGSKSDSSSGASPAKVDSKGDKKTDVTGDSAEVKDSHTEIGDTADEDKDFDPEYFKVIDSLMEAETDGGLNSDEEAKLLEDPEPTEKEESVDGAGATEEKDSAESKVDDSVVAEAAVEMEGKKEEQVEEAAVQLEEKKEEQAKKAAVQVEEKKEEQAEKAAVQVEEKKEEQAEETAVQVEEKKEEQVEKTVVEKAEQVEKEAAGEEEVMEEIIEESVEEHKPVTRRSLRGRGARRRAVGGTRLRGRGRGRGRGARAAAGRLTLTKAQQQLAAKAANTVILEESEQDDEEAGDEPEAKKPRTTAD